MALSIDTNTRNNSIGSSLTNRSGRMEENLGAMQNKLDGYLKQQATLQANIKTAVRDGIKHDMKRQLDMLNLNIKNLQTTMAEYQGLIDRHNKARKEMEDANNLIWKGESYIISPAH